MDFVLYAVVLLVCIVIGYFAFRSKRNRPKNFTSEVVLVTGAAQGIGKALALGFAKCGATVVLWDINEQKLQSTRKELEESGYKAYSYVVNCCKKDDIYAAADRVREEVGDVTVLVSNAGIMNGKTVLKLTDEEIEGVVNLNLLAHFWLVRTFLPSMLEKDHGYIITMASISALLVAPAIADYSATKGATLNFSECLRMEIILRGKFGVSVTCVCPSFVDTEMFRGTRLPKPASVPVIQPYALANEVIQAVANKTFLCVSPGWFYWVAVLKRFLIPTELNDRMFYRRVRKAAAKYKGQKSDKNVVME